jgi:hypothetical protein
MSTPTANTLAILRREGYLAAVVEKWIPKLNRRSDLWRFGDILAVHAQRREFLIVQTTTLGNVSSRLEKAKRQPELEQWLLAGGKFQVHGWTLKDGKRRVKRVEVLAGDLEAIVITNPRRKLKGNWAPATLFEV